MKDSVVLRLPESLYVAMHSEIALWAERDLETFLFLLLTRVDLPDRTLYLGRSVVQLDGDEAVRKAFRTWPKELFARQFYGSLAAVNAFAGGTRVAAVHSHPFSQGTVAFSGIDRDSFKADAEVFSDVFAGVEFIGLVFDRDVVAFEGLVVDGAGSRPVDALQIVGRSFINFRKPNGPGR